MNVSFYNFLYYFSLFHYHSYYICIFHRHAYNIQIKEVNDLVTKALLQLPFRKHSDINKTQYLVEIKKVGSEECCSMCTTLLKLIPRVGVTMTLCLHARLRIRSK